MNSIATQVEWDIVPPERPVIEVYLSDDKEFYCNEFGIVHGWKPKMHESHRHGNKRPCIHRHEPMPHVTLFGAEWVAGLHWWATILESSMVIAQRANDMVTVAFDVIGPVRDGAYRCVGYSTQVPQNRWSYRLYRIKWWDDESPCDHIYLGVWPD